MIFKANNNNCNKNKLLLKIPQINLDYNKILSKINNNNYNKIK
jgi:hypothetical protein